MNFHEDGGNYDDDPDGGAVMFSGLVLVGLLAAVALLMWVVL